MKVLGNRDKRYFLELILKGKLSSLLIFSKFISVYCGVRCGVVVVSTTQLHPTKPELKFCTGLNPTCGVSEICDGDNLWQWPLLKIRLIAFRRSTIPQKQFIIMISAPLYEFIKNQKPALCGALRDLVPFVQFKNVKNTHGGVLILVTTLLN